MELQNKRCLIAFVFGTFLIGLLFPTVVTAQEKYPESNSIAPLKDASFQVIIARRISKGRIHGKLVSFTSKNVVIRSDGNTGPAKTYSWLEFDLVFADGITNAAELLSAATSKIDEIDDTLNNLVFMPQDKITFEELIELRGSALELSDRIKKGKILERILGGNEIPTITEKDREALLEAPEFTKIVSSKETNYTYLKIKIRYEAESKKRGEVIPFWKRLEAFNRHIQGGQFTEAQRELDRAESWLKAAKMSSTMKNTIHDAINEVNVILKAIVEVEWTPTKLEVSQLSGLMLEWKKVERSLQSATQIHALGAGSISAFTETLQGFQKKIVDLNTLIQEVENLTQIAAEVERVHQLLQDPKFSPAEQNQQLALIRVSILDERKKWVANKSSRFQNYAIQELARLENNVDAGNAYSSIKKIQNQFSVAKDKIRFLKTPTEARLLAASFRQLSNELKPFATSAKISRDLKAECRVTMTDIQKRHREAFGTELEFHRTKIEGLNNSLNFVLNQRVVDFDKQTKLLNEGRSSLTEITRSIQEILRLSPTTKFEVDTISKKLGKLREPFSSTVKIMSVRSTIENISSTLKNMDNLDIAQKTVEEQRQILVLLDISDSSTVRDLHSWALKDVEKLELQIGKAKPIISFNRELKTLEKELAELAIQVAQGPLTESRVRVVQTEEHFNLVAGWLNENPELQIEAKQKNLREVQRQQEKLEDDIASLVYKERLGSGWIPISTSADGVLVPPEPANKMVLALAAANQKDHETAHRLVDEIEGADSSSKPSTLPSPVTELRQKLFLRKAQQAEADQEIQNAHELYIELAASQADSTVTAAAATAVHRTRERLHELNQEANNKRQLLAVGIGVLCLLILIGVVLYSQSKSVKLWRARILLLKANREIAAKNLKQADLLVQSASRMVAQYSEKDPAVLDVFNILNSEEKASNSQNATGSTLNVSQSKSSEDLMWVCSSLDASETAVVSIVDQLEEDGVSLSKKQRHQFLKWLVTQFQNGSLAHGDSFSWQIRELSRLVKLFPANFEFRLMLGQFYLKNGEYRKSLEVAAPLLKGTKPSQQKKFQEVVEIVTQSLVALEEWDQLDKLAAKLNRGRENSSSPIGFDLAAIGKQMNSNDASSLDSSRLGKSIDHLLK